MGLTYVGRRPLPLGERSQSVFTADASASLGYRNYEIAIIATNVFDQRYRSRRIQLCFRFQKRAAADAGAHAPFHGRGAPRHLRHLLGELGGQMNEPSRVRVRGYLGFTFTLALVLEACSGTTGGEVIAFRAAASGPRDATAPLVATNDCGWTITLTAATLHVGAIYLNQTVKVSGAQGTGCILPGTYVAQVTTGRDVDLLSPEPQPFPVPGEGTTLPALAAQVWLTGGPIDRIDDPTPILHVEGVAESGGAVRPFSGTVTIGSNRDVTDGDSVQAGASLICNSRIVSPIRTSIALDPGGGALLLRVDPRLLFTNVDFAALPAAGDGFAFSDDKDTQDQPSRNLYSQFAGGRRGLFF